MARSKKPPETLESLRNAILQQYPDLSARLKQVARYVLDEPRAAALETLAEIGERCNVQPSAIVRFAQALGFDGAAPMQRLLKQDLVKNDRPLAYAERVRRYAGNTFKYKDPRQLLHEFVESIALATPTLEETVEPNALAAAVRKIVSAQTIYVAGFRRSFPIASYLAYLLQHSNIRTVLLDGAGGMSSYQASGMTSRDVLIAISFTPYAYEALQLIEKSAANGTALIAITDSQVSPIASSAITTLLVTDPEVRGFRSPAASMCLAQVIGVSVLFETSGKSREQQKI